jgi:S-adenosylmethionine decarboxylase
MEGLHLTADLRGCASTLAPMTDAAALRSLMVAAVAKAGLQPVGELFHRFAAPDERGLVAGATVCAGVTGVVLLAESHVAVHTWPEIGAVTLDVYVCNFGTDNSAAAQSMLSELTHAFAPLCVETHALRRGAEQHGSPAMRHSATTVASDHS